MPWTVAGFSLRSTPAGYGHVKIMNEKAELLFTQIFLRTNTKFSENS